MKKILFIFLIFLASFANLNAESNVKRIYEGKTEILSSTDQILKKYEKNIEHVYFNFDAKKNNPKEKRHSILIIRIKK